jgi:hypothetical protein
MPDSPLLPFWGPAPFEERDLDAVLSGETADIPEALRPVADTLAALRVAGGPAELSGEAAIMAEFRALAGSRARGLGEAARHAGPAAARQLPALPGKRPRGRAAGRHGRRSAAPMYRRAGTLIAAAAAAAAIVAAVVFTGNLTGPMHRAAHSGHAPSASSSPPGLQATGATVHPADSPHARRSPSASPSSPPSSSSDQGRLCHALYRDLAHPGAASHEAMAALFQELSNQAGGPGRVFGYCRPYAGDLIPPDGRHHPGMPPGDGGQGNPDNQPPGDGQAQFGQGGPPGPGGGFPQRH